MSKPGFHEDDPVDKSYDRTLLRRLLRYLRPYKLPVLASFLLIVAMAGLDLVGPVPHQGRHRPLHPPGQRGRPRP